jgi:hypothetical protein
MQFVTASSAASSFKPNARSVGHHQHVGPDLITALRAATTLAFPHEQASLWFTLRVAVLRLAVRGLCSVAPAAAVAVAPAVALGRFRSRRSARGATVGSWPATSKHAHHASTMRGLTQCSTGHLAAARAWPSFHSGPSAVCRKAPVNANVRPRNAHPSLTTLRGAGCGWAELSSEPLLGARESAHSPSIRRSPRLHASPRRAASANTSTSANT